jgi:glycosyltransferase involved in cell wall biosynthesis
MKVLQVVHDFLPQHHAGAEIYTFNLATALAAHGHQVEVCCTGYRGGHETGAGDGDVLVRDYQGLTVREVAFSTFLPALDAAFEVPAVASALARILHETRPDVVHFQHLAHFGPGSVHAAAESGAAVVVTLHDYHLLCLHHGRLQLPDGRICPGPVPEECARCALTLVNVRVFMDRTDCPGDRRLVELAELAARREAAMRRAAGRAHVLIAPSRFLRDVMLAAGLPAEKLVHHDYGFPDRRAPARAGPREGFVVGYLGTIAEYKGVHLLVQALALLADLPHVRGVIHGDPGWFPEFGQRLRREAAPNTRLAGPVPHDRVHEALAGFDVLVVPSTWYENSPLTIHEARQCGLPVIASRLGGMAELVADAVDGALFAPGDAADLARVIRSLATTPRLLAEMRRRAPPVAPIAEDAAWTEGRYADALRAADRSG